MFFVEDDMNTDEMPLGLLIFYRFFKLIILIGDKLLYNIVVVFAIHWHESAMCIHESVLMRWMKLEPIIQNEVSQKEKHQYSILTHICGI